MAEQRVQRRLAAILAADVVAYSRLMEADEEGTRARLRTLHAELIAPRIAADGGRIVKTNGDGILVEFPSAVDAVRNALDIQAAMRRRNADVPEETRIVFRVGINVGDVIVEGDDIHGDGVNVASRLEGLCAPGEVYVSGTVHDHAAGRLAASFEDLGEQTVKNIAEPIHVYAIALEITSTSTEHAGPSDALFCRPAVAVLPFENLSGDSEQDYFSDGLTEDIITALSLWRSFPVIARNSTFAYKGTSPDIRRVGVELGARYVVEGSVRKAGNRVRVSCQLINAETGHHVWAERYDRSLEDIFQLQDDLTQQIAAIISPELERAEQKHLARKLPKDMEAWDAYLRGNALLAEFKPESNEQARVMFERAIMLEPEFSQAYAGLARSHYRDVILGSIKNREESLANCSSTARKAVKLDQTDYFAHMILAIAHYFAREHDPSVSEAEIAVNLNPNSAVANFTLGFHLSLSGRPEEGLAYIEKGLRLNPYEPGNHLYFVMKAHALLNARRYDESLEWLHRSAELKPDSPEPHLLSAVALGHLDRVDRAQEEFATYRRLKQAFPGDSGLVFDHKLDEDKEHFLEGLRRAGIPEQ